MLRHEKKGGGERVETQGETRMNVSNEMMSFLKFDT